MADYISREAMHKANQDEWQGVYGFVDCDIFEDNENMIDRVPAADVRPVVRARWEDETGYIFSVLAQRVYCPACKSYAYFYPQKTKNFCPNCGAYMEGNENG